MSGWFGRRIYSAYERLLERELSGAPTHVAVIQDGNRRYARSKGGDAADGYRAGAETSDRIIEWCYDVGVEELTLYTFSMENFDRSPEERETLFDLLCEKFREFADADRVHENEIAIRAAGETGLLPERLRSAIDHAETRTAGYDALTVNVALAYGGRAELLNVARNVAYAVEEGDLDADDIDVDTVRERLYGRPARDVDLILRTGGDERTSNFLPWHANGNEAAVYFCTPYWPEFRRIDFLRAIRTYENREATWRRTRARRALTLLGAVSEAELTDAKRTVSEFRGSLPTDERPDEADLEPIDSGSNVTD